LAGLRTILNELREHAFLAVIAAGRTYAMLSRTMMLHPTVSGHIPILLGTLEPLGA
jgi:hypothetical protein